MTASRRLAREIALKTLYQIAIGGMDAEEALTGAIEANSPDPSDHLAELAWEANKEHAASVVHGVIAHGDEYDGIVSRYSKGWDLERMPVLDRIILHIALHEIQHEDDVPHGVAINEAVELAKEYSTEDSGRFVNGILGAYVRAEGPEAKPVDN